MRCSELKNKVITSNEWKKSSVQPADTCFSFVLRTLRVITVPSRHTATKNNGPLCWGCVLCFLKKIIIMKDCEWCSFKKKCWRKKKRVPQTLQWDYKAWPGVRISWKGWTGAVLFFSPTILAVFEMHWAGLCRVGLDLSARSQNTQALFSFANHNQMCPDLF